jgi:hypothetical protein
MIKTEKWIQIGSIHFDNTFGSNMLLALQIMNFEDVTLTKFIPILCNRGHEYIIYMI